MYRLPPRQAISDTVTGFVLQHGDEYALSLVASEPFVAQGEFNVRYAIVYLGRSYLAIVPELVAMDTGGGFNGEEAWDFLFNKSNLFPRADVVGFRDDGVDDMVTVKSLDLMHPLRVLVYEDREATKPLAHVSALIAPDTSLLPERLTQALRLFPDVAAWQKAIS
jgi:hypothetical protein